MGEIKIGVLGAGKMGQFHCEFITQTEGLKLVAASSRAKVLTEAVKEKYKIRVYNSHTELLNDREIEWVVIATTSSQHTQWAIEALKKGKNLIIEKPITETYRGAKKIFELAEKNNLLVTVHNNRRWDPDYLLIKEIIEEGTIGEVYRIESRKTGFSPAWPGWGAQGMDNPWRVKKEYGGGFLNDWGPHLIDQILLLKKMLPEYVVGKLYSKIWATEVDDHFWAELIFKDDTSARVEASNNFRIPMPRWFLIGTKGTMEISGGGPTEWNTARIVKERRKRREETIIDISHGELANEFYPRFARAVKEGLPLPVLPNEVLGVMETIELIRQSSVKGCSTKVKT